MQPKIHASGALSFGWEMFKTHFLFLLGGGISSALFVGVPYGLFMVTSNQSGAAMTVLSALLFVAYVVAAIWITNGWLKVLLAMHDGKAFDLSDLFTNYQQVGRLLLANILVQVLTFAGFLAFIIPGFVIATGLSQVPFFIVDKNLGVIEAIKASWNATRGQKWDLVGWWFVAGLFAVMGLLGFFVGIIITATIAMIARVAVYRALSR